MRWPKHLYYEACAYINILDKKAQEQAQSMKAQSAPRYMGGRRR